MSDAETKNGDHYSHQHVKDKKCLEPFTYLNQIPGKDIRGALIDAFQSWLQIAEDKLVIIKEIIAELHNASLLIDDIEDNSKVRRGCPVAHSIYGLAQTINCANYVYFLSLEKCNQLKSTEAVNVFVQELLNLHRGQGQDILWRDTFVCPTEVQYKQMVLDKTGGLFRLAVGLMQCFATQNKSTDFSPLLNSLALYFQIRDDHLNLFSSAYMQTKSYCEDLTEGKFSFPILHAVNKAGSEDTRLLNILRQRTEDVNVKRHAVDFIRSLGSAEYTRNVLRELCDALLGHLMCLGGTGQVTVMTLVRQLDSNLDNECGGTSSNADSNASITTSAAVTVNNNESKNIAFTDSIVISEIKCGIMQDKVSDNNSTNTNHINSLNGESSINGSPTGNENGDNSSSNSQYIEVDFSNDVSTKSIGYEISKSDDGSMYSESAKDNSI